MRIALISKADHSGGGASKMAEDLRKMLLADGHEVVHWVSWSKSGYDSRVRRLYGERFQRKFYRWTRAVKSWFAPDVIPFELPNLFWQNLPANFDLVHFHDISFAASTLSVRYLAKRMPVLWTLHDCSAFTGGCIQPMDCTRYTTGCGQCPQHGLPPLDSRFDYSALKWRLNRRTLEEPLLQVATPSTWLAERLHAAVPQLKPAYLLANTVDPALFAPQKIQQKALLQSQLNLDPALPTILLGAAQLDNPYKGIALGLQALQQLKHGGLQFNLLLVGKESAQIQSQYAALNPRFTGFIDTAERMNDIYAAADLMVYPSIADNQPLQVLEALATNLPVIAFDVGGLAEVLSPICPQWLVIGKNPAQLAARINEFFTAPPLLLTTPRHYIQQRHSHTQLSSAHLDAYQRCIGRWHELQANHHEQ